MAITTLAGAVAGARPPMRVLKTAAGLNLTAATWGSWWYTTSDPVAGVASSAGLAGEALTAPVTGALRWQDPASGNSYLLNAKTMVSNTAAVQANLVLCDRLWQNSGIDVTVTTAQTINSVAWPARDMNGATSGAGVWIALEVSSATGAGAATPTIEYTNSAGGGTKTGTCLGYSASATAGRICLFNLQAGDVGVQSVQTITLGTSLTSGTVHLIALRPICMIEGKPNTTNSTQVDAFAAGFARLYDGSVLQPVVIGPFAVSPLMWGQFTVTQG
jgi:hypothetical protein